MFAIPKAPSRHGGEQPRQPQPEKCQEAARGAYAGDDAACSHALRNGMGARQCVRSAAGEPGNGERMDTEPIGQLGDVVWPVTHATVRLVLRQADSGPINADQPQPVFCGGLGQELGLRPGSGVPVEVEEDRPNRVAVFGVAK